MAPLPQSNTERWWCVYANNGTTHRMMLRTIDGVTNIGASTVFNQLFTHLASTMVATVILNLERALRNSNVRNTFAYTGGQPTGTGTNLDNDQRARTISFVGRSVDGRKTRLFVFGMDAFAEGDYRVDTTENADIAAAIAYMNGAAGVFLSISGQEPEWKGYVNVGYNDHWIKEYRKG